MVGEDEVDDDLRQVVLLRNLHTIGDVADDDLCALLLGEVIVRVDAALLVLGEECGVLHLTDVVVERTRTHECSPGADAVGNLRSEVTHGDGMLEGAGRHLTQLP